MKIVPQAHAYIIERFGGYHELSLIHIYSLLGNIGILLNRAKYGPAKEKAGELAPVLEKIGRAHV